MRRGADGWRNEEVRLQLSDICAAAYGCSVSRTRRVPDVGGGVGGTGGAIEMERVDKQKLKAYVLGWVGGPQ